MSVQPLQPGSHRASTRHDQSQAAVDRSSYLSAGRIIYVAPCTRCGDTARADTLRRISPFWAYANDERASAWLGERYTRCDEVLVCVPCHAAIQSQYFDRARKNKTP